MKRNITIKDLAREAGVSIATVSYCLNGKKKLKDETKEKIEKAIEKLGYNPNFAAKALVTNKSKLIGFVLAQGSLEDNPFYSTLLAGMNSAIKEYSEYDLLIAGTFEEQSFQKAVTKWIRKRGLDGVVFMGLSNKSIIKSLSNLDIPISVIDSENYGLKNIVSIKIDDELGGYLGTKHLISKGHRNIAFVGEGLVGEVTKQRYEGYRKALAEAGIEIRKENLYKTEVNFQGGISVGEKLMKRKDLDAIFTIADILAFGIMRSYLTAGNYIPKDIAIMGFDNLNASSYLTPSLTTIDQNVFEKGKKAVEVLLEATEGRNIKHKEIVIPISLIKGETT